METSEIIDVTNQQGEIDKSVAKAMVGNEVSSIVMDYLSGTSKYDLSKKYNIDIIDLEIIFEDHNIEEQRKSIMESIGKEAVQTIMEKTAVKQLSSVSKIITEQTKRQAQRTEDDVEYVMPLDDLSKLVKIQEGLTKSAVEIMKVGKNAGKVTKIRRIALEEITMTDGSLDTAGMTADQIDDLLAQEGM